MNRPRFGILIPFSKSVILSRITYFLFTTTSNSCLSISIALCRAFAIACTSVVWYTSTYTFLDGCTSASTTFFPPMSFYVVYASTKCYSIASFSSNSSMNTKSTNVVHGPVYFLARQLIIRLHKNSTTNVLVLYILWIILCANCIFSLYAFPSTHSENDDKCGYDLTYLVVIPPSKKEILSNFHSK
jgi:hypothetical protein